MVVKQFKKALPPAVRSSVKRWSNARRIRHAATALERAGDEPRWLTPEMMKPLMAEYPPLGDPAVFTQDVEQKPDIERAREVAAALGHCNAILGIGDGPAAVGWGLKELDALREVTTIDLLDAPLAGATQAGVRGFQGDACTMPFDDNTFDAAYSLNSLEHVHTPRALLDEAWRVVRPGGRIYISFAPIYDAPLGLHAFFEIGVPFCQHLWQPDDIRAIVSDPNLWHLNNWSLEQYRDLWEQVRPRLSPIKYSEEADYRGIEVISRFPSCFAKRSRSVEDFFVSKFVITFQVVKDSAG